MIEDVRLTTKVVTKKLKSGEVKRYRYYQLVKTHRLGKKVKHEYVRYIGKEPPPGSHTHIQDQEEPISVTANREEHDPLVPPEKRPTRAICARCSEEFVLIWFERELGWISPVSGAVARSSPRSMTPRRRQPVQLRSLFPFDFMGDLQWRWRVAILLGLVAPRARRPLSSASLRSAATALGELPRCLPPSPTH